MKSFAYINADSVSTAVKSLGKASLALAGGTDLLNLMKDRVLEPDALVNVKNIGGLAKVESTAAGLAIGANVSIADLLADQVVRERYPALVEALRDIGTPQIRNMSTLGGNLCARPRCWFYRREGFPCLKRGGPSCAAIHGDNEFHAIFGTEQKCVMAHPSSAGSALIAYNAAVEISGPSGSRRVSAEDFFTMPSVDILRENVLGPQELLTGVTIPTPAGPSATYEVRHKESHDWPLALASVHLRLDGASVADARICLGAVAPIPWRSPAAETALKGKTIGEDSARQAAEAAVKDAQPLSQNRFKVQLAKVAVQRAILAATSGRRV
jgi:xanthine dehydrogenase YagS FAD-binding subunit